MNIQTMALRNINRNRRRSILSGTATAVATMAIVFLFALIGGMKKDYSDTVSRYVSGHVRIRHNEYSDNEHLNPLHLRVTNYQDLLETLESRYPEAQLSPRIRIPASLYREDQNTAVQALGVRFPQEISYMNLGDYITRGEVPRTGSREVLIGPGLAEDLGLGVGDTITLLSQTMRRASNAMSFTVSGIVTFPLASLNRTTVLIPLEAAGGLVKMGDAVTEILLRIPDESQARALSREIQNLVSLGDDQGDGVGLAYTADRAGLEILDWESVDMLITFLGLAELIYAVFAFVFFILASTVLINTTMMVVFERTREIGTIGAMGMLGREIVGLFFLEAFFIAVMGALGGLALGTAVVIPLQSIGLDFSEAMSGTSINIPGIIYPQYNLGTSLLVTLYSIVVASLAALLPSRRAASIAPVEALRYQG